MREAGEISMPFRRVSLREEGFSFIPCEEERRKVYLAVVGMVGRL